MNIVERLNGLANYGAGWILWVLVALSVLGAAIAIERAALLVTTRDDIDELRRDLLRLLGRGDAAGARQRLESSPSAAARIAAAGLDAEGAVSARERTAGASERARLDLERRLAFLGTVGANAPFVGLLGTVIGVIRAFRELSAAGGQVSAALMVEVGEALGATAVGLLVALPAVACFNAFQRAIQSRIADGEALAREVIAWQAEVERV